MESLYFPMTVGAVLSICVICIGNYVFPPQSEPLKLQVNQEDESELTEPTSTDDDQEPNPDFLGVDSATLKDAGESSTPKSTETLSSLPAEESADAGASASASAANDTETQQHLHRKALASRTKELTEDVDPINWVKILDYFIFLSLIGAFLYVSNFSQGGDFLRVLGGLFPREFETLGLNRLLLADPVAPAHREAGVVGTEL